MKRPVALLACFALSGCATYAATERALATWHGATIDDAVRQWASPPHSVHNTPTSVIYSWTEGSPAAPGLCRIALETDKGSNIVRASSHAGENCCFVTISGWCGNLPRRQ